MGEFDNENEVKDTDIVFDCPYCSKSLAIDYRGAGLTIQCSDCGSDVTVPIPEGMELDDIDSSEEEQEITIIHLRRALAAAQKRVLQLETELDSLKAHTREPSLSKGLYRIGDIVERAAFLESILEDASKAAAKLLSLCREDIAEEETRSQSSVNPSEPSPTASVDTEDVPSDS